jgi:hypothetical protein
LTGEYVVFYLPSLKGTTCSVKQGK